MNLWGGGANRACLVIQNNFHFAILCLGLQYGILSIPPLLFVNVALIVVSSVTWL